MPATEPPTAETMSPARSAALLRPVIGAGAVLALLVTSGCGMVGGGSEAEPPTAGTTSAPDPQADAGASGSATSSDASTTADAGPRRSGTVEAAVPGAVVEIPEDWRAADRSNSTLIRGDGTTPDEHRIWSGHSAGSDTIPVAMLEYRLDEQGMDPSVPEEVVRERIRDWSASTVADLATQDPAEVGSSLELYGLGCQPGSVRLDGAPSVADFGPDGAGQAIRLDYSCTAFRDPSLGEVRGVRWVTTDPAGRRHDVSVTAYTGFLEQELQDPDLPDRVIRSIRPAEQAEGGSA